MQQLNGDIHLIHKVVRCTRGVDYVQVACQSSGMT